MLRECLLRVAQEYPRARNEQFRDHPLANFIRVQLAGALNEALDESAASYTTDSSAGAGTWADVPWGAVFDPRETDRATKGCYIVYLFSVSGREVFLSLNQGATAVRQEFQRHAREVLQDRAALMGRRLAEFQDRFAQDSIRLGSRMQLPRDYEAGHALGRRYRIADLPQEFELRADLQQLARAYSILLHRGGIDPTPESTTENGELGDTASLEERRSYRMHRRIERNPLASKAAKKFHGTVCQACKFSFRERYGTLGAGFIEAHHLKPLSTLVEGSIVRYDIATDFAVLCSNCHGMIHKMQDPSDLESFRRNIIAP